MMTDTYYTYRFTLHPVGPFFFGGERTFGQAGGSEATYNYFVRSNRFPQQTALLGMLRYELLRLKGLLSFPDGKQEDAHKLIGPASFKVNASESDFGQIVGLSPLCMLRNGQQLFAVAAKDQLADSGHTTLAYVAHKSNKSFRIGWSEQNMCIHTQPLAQLTDYNPKEFNSADLQAVGHSDEVLKWGCAFTETEQIGITKRQGRGQRNDRGFYRRQSFRLQEGWAFCFWAQFRQPFDWQTELVFLGAERSMFRLEVAEANWQQDYEKALRIYRPGDSLPPTGKIVLRSDAYVPPAIYEHCAFALTSTVDFRHIETKTTDKTFKGNPKKSEAKYNLLERGSVLYPATGKLQQLLYSLDNPAFSQIGYNHFTVLPTH